MCLLPADTFPTTFYLTSWPCTVSHTLSTDISPFQEHRGDVAAWTAPSWPDNTHATALTHLTHRYQARYGLLSSLTPD